MCRVTWKCLKGHESFSHPAIRNRHHCAVDHRTGTKNHECWCGAKKPAALRTKEEK